MNLLVISHQRSGTHFLIDSIQNNFNDAIYGPIRPSHCVLEHLFLPHDQVTTDEMYDYLFGSRPDNQIRLIKTHILPTELDKALQAPGFLRNDKERRIIEHLYYEAEKVHIYRDVYDTLISRYHYEKNGGGILVAMKDRFENMSPSEYIRSRNYYIMPSRGPMQFDDTVVAYLANHSREWFDKDVYHVAYEDLKGNYEGALLKLAKHFKVENELKDRIYQPIIMKSNNRAVAKIYDKILKRVLPMAGKKHTAVRPRLGVVGDYKRYFTQADLDFIKKETRKFWKDSDALSLAGLEV